MNFILLLIFVVITNEPNVLVAG